MKQTVVLVSNVFWTISRFRLEIVRRLAASGARVECAAAFDGTQTTVSDAGALVADLPLDRKGRHPIGEWRLVRALDRLVRGRPEALVFLYTIKPIAWGGLVCRLRGVRYACVFTGLGNALGGRGVVARIVRRLAAASARHAAAVACLNERDARFVADLLGARAGGKAPQIHILPGEGVDPEEFVPRSDRPPARDGTTTFLFCSRVLRDKGVDTFIAAADLASQRMPGLRFRIAGWLDSGNPSGLTLGQLRSMIGAAPIEYVGNLADPRAEIADCDAVVLPTRYPEGVPRILLEAACMQKGLIASKVPGCTDVVIDNETGWLVEPSDAHALAAAFTRFASLAPSERGLVGRRARERVMARFSDDAVWRAYLRIFRSMGLPLAG